MTFSDVYKSCFCICTVSVVSRNMKEKYDDSLGIKEKTDSLMLYLWHHGSDGVRKIVQKLMSYQLGGAVNTKEWRMLLGVSWKM